MYRLPSPAEWERYREGWVHKSKQVSVFWQDCLETSISTSGASEMVAESLKQHGIVMLKCHWAWNIYVLPIMTVGSWFGRANWICVSSIPDIFLQQLLLHGLIGWFIVMPLNGHLITGQLKLFPIVLIGIVQWHELLTNPWSRSWYSWSPLATYSGEFNLCTLWSFLSAFTPSFSRSPCTKRRGYNFHHLCRCITLTSGAKDLWQHVSWRWNRWKPLSLGKYMIWPCN